MMVFHKFMIIISCFIKYCDILIPLYYLTFIKDDYKVFHEEEIISGYILLVK